MSLRELPRIERLDLSVVELPDWHPEAPNHPNGVSVFGYVIDHPEGPIVFDTGVGFGNDFIDEVYVPRSEQLAIALATHGIALESVVAVVNSHLHFDHCGQNPAFFGLDVPIYAQRAEIETVADDEFYTDRGWALAPEAQRRILDGDAAIADGVTIVSTPGHTPGHQSLVVEAAAERVVLAGQLVWALSEFVDARPSPTNLHAPEWAEQARESIDRVRGLDARRVYFGHCPHHDQL